MDCDLASHAEKGSQPNVKESSGGTDGGHHGMHVVGRVRDGGPSPPGSRPGSVWVADRGPLVLGGTVIVGLVRFRQRAHCMGDLASAQAGRTIVFV